MGRCLGFVLLSHLTVNFMANFRGINPLLADVWATVLGNSSLVLRVPTTYTNRDYVDSGLGLQDSITVTPRHNLTSLPPARPITK